MKKKVLITSALPYANGPLHFGHLAGAYLPADCYARFERLKGSDVLYICGSDEYGVAITLSAEMAGKSPKEHVDHFHAINQNFFNKLCISFDHFSRTTHPLHKPIVQQFFKDLLEKGFIEEKETEQLYSEPDHKFLADRYVIGTCPRCGYDRARGDECGKCGASYESTDLISPRSKISNAPLTKRLTRHWFLQFHLFKDRISKFLEAHPWRSNVLHFSKSYVEDLRPRAITRDLDWGVPVPLPDAKGKVFYVWFDAPIGYISATMDWAEKVGNKELWKDYWLDPKTKYVQFIGKDNIPFHAIFFPAMIMGQSIPYKLVDDLVASEFYNLEGRQFSKSEGWTIDLEDFFKRFHVDQIRYAIASNAPETGDSEFVWKDFQTRCNAELLGKFGNLINRVLVFIQNKCEGKIPPQKTLEEADHRFLNQLERLSSEIDEAFETYRLRKACQLIMEMAQSGNSYFDAKTPWKDAKFEASIPAMQTTIYCCLECIKRLALFASPIMPSTCQKIWEMIGFTSAIDKIELKKALDEPLKEGLNLPKPYLLFEKVEDDVIEKEVENLRKMHSKAMHHKEDHYPPIKEAISIDHVRMLDLRVGKVLSAEKVPDSKKLLRLQVDLGLEKRTIVSGISQSVSPEEIVGKKVVVVANLKPAKIMGIESQGMILAGANADMQEVLHLEKLPEGSSIH